MVAEHSFAREAARKCFHLLSLLFLAAYRLIGYPAIVWALGAWTLLVIAVELGRLRHPGLNDAIIALFGGIIRKEELKRVSATFHTSTGSWLTIALFGRDQGAVTAGLLCLALGDTAAALIGRAWGRVRFKIGTRTRSLEGAAACFAVCLWAVAFAGYSGPALWLGALAATAAELASPWPDDNFWIPLAAAASVSLFS